jgi:heptosyltransferase-3
LLESIRVSNSKGRILVVRGGNLGEFILTCPVLAALRAQFPETEIEVLGYPRFADLAKAAGLIDEVRSIETRAAAGFFARNAPLDEDLSNYFAKFSVIFSYLYDPDGFFQMNVCKVSAAQFIQGRSRPDEGSTLHASDTFLKPLERLAIFEVDASPRLSIQRPATSHATIAIHPNPETGPRAWPEAKWRNLAQAILAKTSYQLVLIGDEAQTRTLQRLVAEFPANRATLLSSATLPELASQLGACQAFVGHDSGVSHLAAALGIPSVIIWGNSNATIWKPRGDHVTVLNNRSGAIGVTQEEVLSALPMVWSGAE